MAGDHPYAFSLQKAQVLVLMKGLALGVGVGAVGISQGE